MRFEFLTAALMKIHFLRNDAV